MGIFDKLNKKAQNWASNNVINKVEKTVDNTFKEKRLEFVGNSHVNYTDKLGVKKRLSFDQMTDKLMEAMGEGNLALVGVTHDMVKEVLVKAQEKYMEVKSETR